MNIKYLTIAIFLVVAGSICLFLTFYQGGAVAPKASFPCAVVFFGISIMFFRHLRD